MGGVSEYEDVREKWYFGLEYVRFLVGEATIMVSFLIGTVVL